MINFFRKIFQREGSKLTPPIEEPPIEEPPSNEAGFNGTISFAYFGRPASIQFKRGSKKALKERLFDLPGNELVWVTDHRILLYRNNNNALFKLNFEEVTIDEL